MKKSRVLLTAATSATAVFVLSSPAFAHVSVQPDGEAAKGGYATIGFKVPNERDDASTTKLEITFPTEHPLASVLPQPVPGWKAKVTKSKLDKPIEVHGNKITEAVTKVTWTAEGKGVEPGFFQRFPVSVGQLPENSDQLVFKALQTYSNKEVVRWIEAPTEGGEEPQYPAPVLALSAAEEGHHGGTGGDAKDAEGSEEKEAKAEKGEKDAGHGHEDGAKDTASSSHDSDTTARVLGIAGIAVGAAGVAFGVLAGRRAAGSGTKS
ncbi:YcnI family protein [Streptomyces sp. NPDC059816]|uniref:YcnI family copper-binding membrane protein n=1 Tax=Streptomyces sp. NPDC059816 TaxID=3346960 RepID=UPI00365D0500